MSPWLAKALVFVANVVMIAIRAPYGKRAQAVEVAKNRKGRLEVVLLVGAGLGYIPPIVWCFTPIRIAGDYPPRWELLAAGGVLYALGIWVIQRSHVALGANWSNTLVLRKDHHLITHGIYRYVRHPMYSGLLLWSIGQACALPNYWIGPSYLVMFGFLVAFRLRAEERMMLEEFGEGYVAYRQQTKRLIPGIW